MPALPLRNKLSVLLLLSSLSLSGQTLAAPADPAVPAKTDLDETAPVEEHLLPTAAKSRYPYLDIHGDYRCLWGKGRFSAYSRNPLTIRQQRQDGSVILTTRRLRLFPFYHISPHTSVRLMLEDNRNDKNHTADRHLYLSRAYVQHETEQLKLEAGRFNYYLLDGNVMDHRIDGLRLRLGNSETPSGSLTVTAGQTAGTPASQKRRICSLLYRKKNGRLSHNLTYINARAKKGQPQNLTGLAAYGIKAGRAGQGYDQQEIGEYLISYMLSPDLTLSLDTLLAAGRHQRDNYKERQHGFVAALEYGQLREAVQGSHRVWLRYYDQPSATVLYHTMDADTGFFRRFGFRGWGARLDYILRPGLTLAVESFHLHNRHDNSLGRNFSENVLGASLTAYF